MYAITVKQPWAEAIARYGCNVLNRPRRPPAHLIGQRVAIHVGREWSDRLGLVPADLVRWTANALVKGPPPHAGRIIATARLVGWVRTVHSCDFVDVRRPDEQAEKYLHSPWFTGPVGWVLADVRALAVPVGQSCLECGGDGWRDLDDCGGGLPCLCRDANWPYGIGVQPIRGQVYPFALSPEIEAAILRQGG